jgi:Fur family peroxide stress response transcriptional regulator
MPHRVERLHQAGLKATGPRLMILEAIGNHLHHPTVEQIHRSLLDDHPSLSLSTVYETLDVFIRNGLCRRVTGAGDRMRVDGTPQDHDHAVCQSCGEIFDIDRQVFPLPLPPAQLPNGLLVKGLRLEYDVICAACREAAEGP